MTERRWHTAKLDQLARQPRGAEDVADQPAGQRQQRNPRWQEAAGHALVAAQQRLKVEPDQWASSSRLS